MELSAQDFTRLTNNFYNSQGLDVGYDVIALNSHFFNYINQHQEETKKKFKIALCCICVNPPYWEYAKTMIEGAKQFFLPGHQTDFFLWSDMPNCDYGATVIPTESVEWPMPTLMRYSLFLQQEEKLREYDYLFFCDIDMRFVNVVGDEILGEGLTAALHPGYATRKEYWPPYEPNSKSTAYIPRPGKLVNVEGKQRFMPMYFAGGFQGGKTDEFIKAMKEMKDTIDKDFNKNYVSIWNDEGHWNKYLEKTPENLVVLNPSYIYPDSLIKEWYIPLWGRDYMPRLITITKKHNLTKEGGEAIKKMIGI